MIQYVLMDIEGTTSSIDFVHKTLFPYANERLEAYLQKHQNEPHVQKALKEFNPDLSLDKIILEAKKMIKDDVKYGPLKTIQGLIWEQGYKSGEIKGHIYAEVPEVLQKWMQQGFKLGIYSSGSVLAQKLIFGFTEFGDLTKYLSHFFDTAFGHKKETPSYQKIAAEIKHEPQNILFLSDRPEELEAAAQAGFQVILVNRDETKFDGTPYKQVTNFNQIEIL